MTGGVGRRAALSLLLPFVAVEGGSLAPAVPHPKQRELQLFEQDILAANGSYEVSSWRQVRELKLRPAWKSTTEMGAHEVLSSGSTSAASCPADSCLGRDEFSRRRASRKRRRNSIAPKRSGLEALISAQAPAPELRRRALRQAPEPVLPRTNRCDFTRVERAHVSRALPRRASRNGS